MATGISGSPSDSLKLEASEFGCCLPESLGLLLERPEFVVFHRGRGRVILHSSRAEG